MRNFGRTQQFFPATTMSLEDRLAALSKQLNEFYGDLSPDTATNESTVSASHDGEITSLLEECEPRVRATIEYLAKQHDTNEHKQSISDNDTDDKVNVVAAVFDADAATDIVFLAGLTPSEKAFRLALDLLNAMIGDDDLDDDVSDESGDDSDDSDSARHSLRVLRRRLIDLHVASSVPAVRGLIEDAAFTPAFEDALRQTFGRFDVDGDGALNEAEFAAYHHVVNESEPDDHVWPYLHANFECNEDGALTLTGWMQLYFAQVRSVVYCRFLLSTGT